MGSAQNKILVVDDDFESRSLLCEVLEANGYLTHSVADGVAAHEVLLRDPDYRIVIADLRMPQESGLELLRRLRKEKTRHAVILMSSFMSEGEKKTAKTLGVQALLEKPFKIKDLLAAVASIAEQDSVGVAS